MKAKQETILVRVSRLKRNCNYEGDILDHADFEQPPPLQPIHPARLNLEDGIFTGVQIPSDRTPLGIFTKGSKIEDQTSSAFCAMEKVNIIKTWKAKLSPTNTVFQAETLVLKAAIEWANTNNKEVTIWSDSQSGLQALKSFSTVSKIIQEAHMALLANAKLG
ncbi:hypothetical protein AVEN_245256-1 [Araneus ventricosus]|uniref:RNase H type-1 domain-containing protein n=1 Tax=Araneus ventricosus TaxID=182803 RepID=A0A4Y2EE37_ARAVE|nr:hypothetical protein AVEN_245256-1 [Araneus ventricosus]